MSPKSLYMVSVHVFTPLLLSSLSVTVCVVAWLPTTVTPTLLTSVVFHGCTARCITWFLLYLVVTSVTPTLVTVVVSPQSYSCSVFLCVTARCKGTVPVWSHLSPPEPAGEGLLWHQICGPRQTAGVCVSACVRACVCPCAAWSILQQRWRLKEIQGQIENVCYFLSFITHHIRATLIPSAAAEH